MAKVHLILQKHFLTKQRVYPRYSMRSLARDLKMSPSFVSRVLSGKQEFPIRRLKQFAEALDIDALALKEIKILLANNFFKDLGLNSGDLLKISKASTMEYQDKSLTLKDMSVLAPWYNIAILEMTTCEGFQSSLKWIAKKLNLSESQVEKSISFLVNNGYLEENNGQFRKTTKQIRLKTYKSMDMVRQYHKSMMELAVKEMYQNTDEKSFNERLITSTSIAGNSKSIELAKEKIAEMQLEVAEILREGTCDRVYDLTVALFPVAK